MYNREVIEIPLGLNARKHVGYVTRIDDDDYDIVAPYRWCAQPHYNTVYAVRSTNPGKVSMHYMIMGAKGIDHADGDGLNNQKCNLREANQSQQNANMIKRTGTSSVYKGVSRDRSRRKWAARIMNGGRRYFLGNFDSEMDAALAYDAAARKIYGRFACLNFPEGK